MARHYVCMPLSPVPGGVIYWRCSSMCRVVATCRAPDGAAELRELRAAHPDQLSIVQLDCTDEGSIAEAAQQVSCSHGHLDLLLNVAGILHMPGKMSPGTCCPSQSCSFRHVTLA